MEGSLTMLNSKKLAISLTLSAFALSGFSGEARANVSLKNGNFFIGYTDIVYPGGFEPKIERVYNSKTYFDGMFGWNWGNEYEVFLSVMADGSVVAHEYGGGAENRFTPASFKPQELDQAVQKITAVAQSVGALSSKESVEAYKKRLRSDAFYRNDEWTKYLNQGKIAARKLAVGTKLLSNRFSFQVVSKLQDGYLRSFENGRSEKFNESGKLVRISDKNGNFIDIAYGKDSKIQKVVDNFNRKIFFVFNTKGKVEKIQGENGKESSYKYNDKGELVWTKDVEGNVYEHRYADDKSHNMLQIKYSDRTTMDIAYYGKDKFENVRSIKERDGALTEYLYQADPRDKMHTTVGIRVKGKDGKLISNSSYEYFYKKKADGEDWTYKMVSSIDGDRTETVYNECCGLPLLIKRGKEETAFEYDAKGHVTKKSTPSEITMLSYDSKFGKVAKVARYSKLDPTDKAWSQFQYDERGNLVFAKNSQKQGVKLFYDGNGRIKSMVDQGRRRIDFKYNENSKPIEISDPSVGSITVSYANSGEIKKVESTAGRRIAQQVTSAFQNLLDIIRPAGVTLSF